MVNKFVWFKGKKGKIWKQIEKFCCKPSVFQMKELQFHIEDDMRRNNPDISDDEVKEKVRDLTNNIENQIKDDFKQKYSQLSEEQINKKVREVNVKGYLTGDREKYLREAFNKKNHKTYGKFHMLGGRRGQAGSFSICFNHFTKMLLKSF